MKDFYWEMFRKKCMTPKCIEKWEEVYYYITFDWENIYQIPFLVARETELQSSQYKVIKRYLHCNVALKLWNKKDSDICAKCNTPDTIEHFLYFCNLDFWNLFLTWWNDLFSLNLNLGTLDIIFGVPIIDDKDNNDAFNFSLLYGKYFIYICKLQEKAISFGHFKCHLKN